MKDHESRVTGPDDVMDELLPQWGPVWLRGITAFVVGTVLLQAGFNLLGVRLEFFAGLQTFSLSWIISMSLLPVLTGMVIGMIYGFGGKYLAHFPPALVLIFSYYQSMHQPVPEGAHLLPMGMMTMFVILNVEFCAVGGFLGEIIIRRKFGWGAKYVNYNDAERLPEETETTKPDYS